MCSLAWSLRCCRRIRLDRARHRSVDGALRRDLHAAAAATAAAAPSAAAAATPTSTHRALLLLRDRLRRRLDAKARLAALRHGRFALLDVLSVLKLTPPPHLGNHVRLHHRLAEPPEG
eukprot:CAMPEP_0170134702 /NCGR_PEP_ID=MMETSP0033_2-20121228/2060_1 /TAXON_ID=195969 /ORGANISM="Dolichomastix tenuilepis, Strain CCMP3274" /LENGTH=117 /DNA_ID=CAMNT_0010370273 /DNA_START=86 /DNA_END=439 /DNA_ORIENTATION=-